MKYSFIPLKIHSNFKALSVKNGFSPCKDLNSKENQFEILAKGFVKPLEGLRKPVAGALFVGFLFFICDPNSVWAASGGRMGGGVSSSRSSSSSSSSSSRSSSSKRISSSTEEDAIIVIWTMVWMALCVFTICYILKKEFTKYSVLKLQVGLLGLKSGSLKKDLNCIAETADTSNPEGRRYLLLETIIALLLTYPDHHRIYAHSSVEGCFAYSVMERFEKVSAEERGKFDEETLVNINNIKKKKKYSTKLMRRSTGIGNEYIVVTILVCAQGYLKDLLCINNSKDLKEALLKLAAIPYLKETLAIEVLWTPQEEDDTLSEEEFFEDYPFLKQLL